jgi:acyl-CoA thioesterase-1
VLLLAATLCAGGAHAAERPLLVCFGDSITAGLGLTPGQTYPDALQRDLDRLGYHYKVDNQGTSGATSKDAVASLPAILRLHPEVVIVEFGGNDGLRGLPPDQTRANLDQVLTALERAHIKILLAGITLPPNYGSDYIRQFEQDLINQSGVIQQDGIHPTAKGAEMIANTLVPALKPLLHK